MSARDNVVPILIGLAVCGTIVTTGLVIQHNRASVQEAPPPANAPPNAGPNVQPAPPGLMPPTGTSRPFPDWERYIETGRLIGPKNAPLTLVEFADFECPACKTLHGQLDELRKEFPGVIAISYHYVPLPYHEMGYPAARAAECAADQGRFEQMYDKLYENSGSLTMARLGQLGVEAGVPDRQKFDACIARTDEVERIETDRANAMGTLQIRGTPTVLVNGQMYHYAPKKADLRKMVEDARSRARAR